MGNPRGKGWGIPSGDADCFVLCVVCTIACRVYIKVWGPCVCEGRCSGCLATFWSFSVALSHTKHILHNYSDNGNSTILGVVKTAQTRFTLLTPDNKTCANTGR